MMIAPTLTDYGLDFTRLSARDDTELIVIHHTGDSVDDDLSAEDIHRIHLMNGWADAVITILFARTEKLKLVVRFGRLAHMQRVRTGTV